MDSIIGNIPLIQNAMKVLIIEPRARLGSSINRILKENFIPCIWEQSLISARKRALQGGQSVIIVTHEPDISNGFNVAKDLRSQGVQTAILLLARDNSSELYQRAFEAGVNDVLKRPFNVDILLEKVRYFIIRYANPERTILTYGPIRYDMTAKRTYVGSLEIRLTARETLLLQTLLIHRGQVLSRSQLINQVWGSAETPFANVVDVQILRLRKSLGEAGREIIKTIHGFGYRLGD